jgi:prepilin signal peptidase PulO-like enzyme (type II secretory pathway)
LSIQTIELIGQIGIYIFAFIFGAAIGSFLNVCIYRLPKGESLVKRNSHCMTCGAEILHRDLVPIFSWIFLRGKCRSCGAPISPRYCIVESLTGLLFVGVFIKFDVINFGFVYPAILCLFLASVVVVGFEDYDTQEMSLSVLITSAIIAIGAVVYRQFDLRAVNAGFAPDLMSSIIGMFSVALPILLIGFVMTPLIYRGFLSEDHKLVRRFNHRLAHDTLTNSERTKLTKLLEEAKTRIKIRGAVFGFGMGDVVLMAAAGLILGYKATIVGTFFAIVFAAVFGIIKIKLNERQRGSPRGQVAQRGSPRGQVTQNDIAAEDSNSTAADTQSTDETPSNAFAFGPFLCIGIAIGAYWGDLIWSLYFSQMAK